MQNADYLHYYYLENYLFMTVSEKYRKNHRIDSFDFMCILKWQCRDSALHELKNSMIKTGNRLKEIPKRYNSNFDFLIKKITRDLYACNNREERADMLFSKWGIPGDIVINLLSVLFPDDYLFYSENAAKSLDGKTGRKFQQINSLKSFQSFWKRYIEYTEKINKAAPAHVQGNDRVRWTAGKQIQKETRCTMH